MYNVSFIKDYEYKIKKHPCSEGQLLFTTDTGKLFLDITSSTRIRINSIYKITKSEKDTINPIEDGIYYVTDNNEFLYYDGSKYVSFGERDGLGNIIASTYISKVENTGTELKYTMGDGTVKTVDLKGIGAKWKKVDTVQSAGNSAPSGTREGDFILDPNSNVYVVNSSLKLDFAMNIKGAKGDKGNTGEKGDKGDKGDPGDLIRVGQTFTTSQEECVFFKEL